MYDIGMAEKDSKSEKKEQLQSFMFPNDSISIEATSLREATNIYQKTLKQNKESDNG